MIGSKFISAAFEEGKRILKVVCFGKADVRTAEECAPFGCDANPIANMRAIYGSTTSSGRDVIVGYINVNQLAAPGENRKFATDSDGNVVFNIWQRGDGTVLIGMSVDPGDYTDNAVRYSKLDQAVQNDIVTFINTELGKIATGISGAGGAYTPGTMNIDLTASKINEIKTQ